MTLNSTGGEALMGAACALSTGSEDVVELAHGSGGQRMHDLLREVFLPAFGDPLQARGHDSAVFHAAEGRMAITTDAYVVRPLEFPGGDIGSLAVHGTVNDLLVGGARPSFLSASFILEAGLPLATLRRLVDSMRAAATASGVDIVTGDTKVVERGHGDGLYITTSGVGFVPPAVALSPVRLKAGDRVILSGDIGRHGIAIMAAREGLVFTPAIHSDSAPLTSSILPLLHSGLALHCLRDLTRGGLASAVIELAGSAGVGINLDEGCIAVRDDVAAACELLGLDPLHVANEGRFIAVVPEASVADCLALLAATPQAADARVIGEVTPGVGRVYVTTPIGTQRPLSMLSGEQLPRIC